MSGEQYAGPERRKPNTRHGRAIDCVRRWSPTLAVIFGLYAIWGIHEQQEQDKDNRVVVAEQRCGFYKDVIDYIDEQGAPAPVRMIYKYNECIDTLNRYRREATE